MRDITAVGFDMDYTLAQYLPQSFEQRAYYEAQQRLVHRFGYPAEVADLKFQWDYMTKGLIVDKVLGNVLKVDRHNYVKVAYHGFRELPSEERKRIYRDTQRSSEVFSEASYAMVDTLFSLAESFLFMQLVEMKDRKAHPFFEKKCYRDMYMDLRVSVDMGHRDGSLKRVVAADPGRYMHPDPHLKDMLESFRRSGRRVFLATNSLWDYTNVVMNFMLYGKSGSSRDHSWLSLFDLVLVGCSKPGFFQHRAPLYKVDIDTGLLRNTDNGAPVTPIDVDDIPTQTLAGGSLAAAEGGECGAVQGFGSASDRIILGNNSSSSNSSNNNSNNNKNSYASGLSGMSVWPQAQKSSSHHRLSEPARASAIADPRDRVFQGGCFIDLHNLLGVKSGSEILYAGDHIYGDIVKSKRAVGWRTMLVVPELELELDLLAKSRHTIASLSRIRRARDELDDKIQRLRRGLADYSDPSDNVEGDEATPAAVAESVSKWLLDDLNVLVEGKAGGGGREGSNRESDQSCFSIIEQAVLRTSSPPASTSSTHSSYREREQQGGEGGGSYPLIAPPSLTPAEVKSLRSLLKRLEAERAQVKAVQSRELRQHHMRFHPVWGQVMKTGYQNSRLAHQVERYACLYTSHIANLAFISPDRSFAGRMDYLAHELEQI
eukprot:CAMPEP_0175086566 /NCGR_PEP_ID=MMETSP0052_2-20121109/29319_1 /TAXON_ID=51329 ORGANISM="Polytomella parva, Strain SAG 63-3" /NCGR_SAMPLE_ID=MMETSP0052_2 /ASSEMBLY_ACC=CAM_ASM_000194 /LENGTH=657 /DNA_ID=CAMNT_0016358761 /DNA_START=466 /DNA_END=2439 /DNA_ORIENTATION=+